MTKKSSKTLEERVSDLEKAVFGSKKPVIKKTEDKYKGLIGGLTLLIDNGFFKKPVLVNEVQDELKKEGYFSLIQSTDTLLRRSFVKRRKALTRLKVDGVWQYVIRK